MGWPVVALGEVAKPIKRLTVVEPGKIYRLLGMRSQIGGPFLRETKDGAGIAAAVLNKTKTGDFIYSRLFAWQGSFGVISEAFDECYVSNEFPLFRIDAARLDPRFLTFWFGLPDVQRFVEVDCFGSTPGTRNRYKEEYFLRLEAPVPPLQEQHRIVARLDKVAALMAERSKVITSAERDANAMLSNAFRQVIDDAPYQPMAEVAPLVRRPVEIDPAQSYPELGVRSFGRGTFHKPALDGSKLTWQKLFLIQESDLVFSNIKAWEGAFAVAKPEDDNRVGSHRYLTCVPIENIVTANFVWFYLQSQAGLEKVAAASPGSADRNRTFGQKALAATKVPVPPIDRQRWFDRLQGQVRQMGILRESAGQEVQVLLPAMLDEVFNGKDVHLLNVSASR